MSKKILLVAGILCVYSSMSARDLVIGVDSILTIISSKSADVRAARSDYEYMHQGIEVARSARLPEVSASLDLNYIGDGTILDRDFTNAMRDKLPHFGNTLSVNIYQPVYTGGAISAGIDLATQKAELAAIGVEQQTDATGIQTIADYFNLAKMYNLRKVYEANIQVTEKLIDQMTERHLQGTVLKNDITRYELRLSSLRFELQTVNNTISVLNNNLVTMLGLECTSVIKPSVDDTHVSAESEAYWQEMTLANSSDLRAISKSRNMAETSLKLDRAERLPSVGIVVADHLSGPVTFEIPAINKNYNAWFVGFTVSFKLSSLWTTNKKERQSKSRILHIDDQKLAMTEALGRKIHEAYIACEQTSQQIETEKVNVRLANENFGVVETRFSNGMALLTDMLDATNAKLDAEIRLVNARINHLLSYYQLKYISGTLNK